MGAKEDRPGGRDSNWVVLASHHWSADIPPQEVMLFCHLFDAPYRHAEVLLVGALVADLLLRRRSMTCELLWPDHIRIAGLKILNYS